MFRPNFGVPIGSPRRNLRRIGVGGGEHWPVPSLGWLKLGEPLAANLRGADVEGSPAQKILSGQCFLDGRASSDRQRRTFRGVQSGLPIPTSRLLCRAGHHLALLWPLFQVRILAAP